jgi:hypothetical protein
LSGSLKASACSSSSKFSKLKSSSLSLVSTFGLKIICLLNWAGLKVVLLILEKCTLCSFS